MLVRSDGPAPQREVGVGRRGEVDHGAHDATRFPTEQVENRQARLPKLLNRVHVPSGPV